MKFKIKIPELLKRILITLASIAVFYLLGRYAKITTGIYNTYVFLQYPLLCIISILYGPIVGVIVATVGHCLIDIANSSFVWWSWVSASGLEAVMLGLISRYWLLKHNPHPLRELRASTRVKYAIVIMGTMVISFLFFGPILEMIIYKATFIAALRQGLFAAFSNGLISVIVTDLFFSSFRHTVVRRSLSIITLLDALVLVSYGNKNVGSIILYIITILFGLYLFFYEKWNLKSRNKFIQFCKTVIFVGFIAYALEILFLAVFSYANRPVGDEKIAIVLGAGLSNDKPSKILQMRLDKAYEWYLEDPDNHIIVTSGGQGDDEIIPEGVAMRNYLISIGVPENKVFAEDKSKTTEENFKFSLGVLQELGHSQNDKAILVTNNFHCFRALGYATKAGFTNIKSLAAPTPIFGIIPNYLREGLAFAKYLVFS